MPGYDKTGPQGQGPMTGRGWGRCSPQNPRGFYRQNQGFSFGFGGGKRRNMGRGFSQHVAQDVFAPGKSELDDLNSRISSLGEMITQINRKLEDMGKKEKV
ncbi:MAG: DUF5320 domain-containing protein [Proteobacteria bacterium]|nr:DUF5320 domain-containing protein [Pseudomonadota bacterium]